MGKFTTYRYLELQNETNGSVSTPTRTRSIKQPRGLKRIFILLVILAVFLMYVFGLFSGQHSFLDNLAKTLGYESPYHHAVIIDAGSSGSRVLAYKFRVPFTVFGQPNLDLVEEFFAQSKPGLSSFVDDPQKGADSIVQLIKKAEHITPLDKRKDTPIIVRATAGLRLLSEEKAQMLLDNVAKAIASLGYNTTADSVKIMDGSDEGIYIWYTVNLLNNIMEGETVAALDLGGGSTQITYALTPPDIGRTPKTDVHAVPNGAYNLTVYTHSYLNLGLLAARYGIFRLENDDPNAEYLESVCVDPIVQQEPWIYVNKEYRITGSSRQSGMKKSAIYSRCHSVVRTYVMSTLDWEPSAPPHGDVAAMSFFYDVAADAGIIDVMQGGKVSVKQYREAALIACTNSNIDQPWACIDLVYITTLLQDAYKITDNQPISLFKKVNGHEVSWALGLAYTNIMHKVTTEKA